MKKTYQKPESTINRIVMSRMLLQASNNPNVTIGSGTVDADKVESRRGSFWDDEEE